MKGDTGLICIVWRQKQQEKILRRQKREEKPSQIMDDNDDMKMIINFPITLYFPLH